MSVYVSTSCLEKRRNIFDILETYARAGLRNVELGVPHKYVEDLPFIQLKQYNFNYIVHHYFPPPREPFIVNLASRDDVILKRSREQMKKSIEFCYNLGIRLFSFHAGFRTDPDENLRFLPERSIIPYETAFDTFAESVEELDGFARDRGVRIAIENNVLSEYNVVDGQNRFLLLCQAEEFEKLRERVPSDNVGMLLDLGHLKVTSHWLGFDRQEFIDKVNDRVFAIHVHENNGRVDEHGKLDESSWCFEVISRKCFADLPVVIECTGLTVEQVSQQVDLVENILGR